MERRRYLQSHKKYESVPCQSHSKRSAEGLGVTSGEALSILKSLDLIFLDKGTIEVSKKRQVVFSMPRMVIDVDKTRRQIGKHEAIQSGEGGYRHC